MSVFESVRVEMFVRLSPAHAQSMHAGIAQLLNNKLMRCGGVDGDSAQLGRYDDSLGGVPVAWGDVELLDDSVLLDPLPDTLRVRFAANVTLFAPQPGTKIGEGMRGDVGVLMK